MKLKRLKLEQFRCFHEVELDLVQPGGQTPLQVALLVGPNGAGKSAVLEAISGLVTASHGGYGGVALGAEDVRLGAEAASLHLELTDEMGRAEGFERRNISLDATLLAQTTMFRGFTFQPGLHGFFHNVEASREANHWREWVISPDLRPTGLIVGFDAYRAVPRRKVDGPSFAGAPLHRTAISLGPSSERTAGSRFGLLKQWIINLDYQRLRTKVDQGQELPTWQMLKDALDSFFDPLRLERVSSRMEVLFSTPDGEVELDRLSSGFQSVFVIITELIMRLALCTADPSKALLQEGVCLIDEIDVHLHPRWQKRIVPALRQLFPNVQFIMTTHSPLVVSTALPSEIFQFSSEGFE